MKKSLLVFLFMVISLISLSATDIWSETVYAEVTFPFSLDDGEFRFRGFEINGFMGTFGMGVTFYPFGGNLVLAVNMQYMQNIPVEGLSGWFTPLVSLRLGILGPDSFLGLGAGTKFYWDYYEHNYLSGSAMVYYDTAFGGGGFHYEFAPGLGGDKVADILTFGGSSGSYYTVTYY